MNKLFDESMWNDFIDEKISVNCKTKEESDEFLDLCNKKSINHVDKDMWNKLKENTCYKYTLEYSSFSYDYYFVSYYDLNEKIYSYQIVEFQSLKEDKWWLPYFYRLPNK